MVNVIDLKIPSITSIFFLFIRKVELDKAGEKKLLPKFIYIDCCYTNKVRILITLLFMGLNIT